MRYFSFENDVIFFFVGDEVKIRSEEVKYNWEIFKKFDFVKIRILKDLFYIKFFDFFEFDVIVDVFLGVGMKGELRELIWSVIEKINEYFGKVKIVSVDFLSGYLSDICVKCDFVVIF